MTHLTMFIGAPQNFRSPLKFSFPPKKNLFFCSGPPQLFCSEIFRSLLKLAGCYHVDIRYVTSYRIQFQGKCLLQTKKKDKKPQFGYDLGPLGPNSGCQFFFFFFFKNLAASDTEYYGLLSD